MSLDPGARLGPYEIIGPLGAGGMGEVYRARDPRSGVRSPSRRCRPHRASTPIASPGSSAEAEILASLNHPHIAPSMGWRERRRARASPPSQFLILELVEGGTLPDRIALGSIAVGDVLTMARQVADALHAAHDKGIIHRDLKPGNIALTRDGQVKVLDFGLAKAMVPADASTAAVHVTETGLFDGTGGYMSPEQVRGHALDKRTDIWSFGCVAFEALTGRSPFYAATVSDVTVAILAAIRTGRPAAPPRRLASVAAAPVSGKGFAIASTTSRMRASSSTKPWPAR